MINIEELKEQLLQGTFYYSKPGALLINAKVYNVISYDDGELEIFFTGGMVSIYKDKLIKVKRPLNIISVLKWCYSLKNEDNENIGHIGEKEREEV